jgi:hypothetical protein
MVISSTSDDSSPSLSETVAGLEWQFTPSNGTGQSYLFKYTVSATNETDERALYIRTDAGLIVPARNESADPTTRIQNVDPARILSSTNNESSNPWGWAPALEEIIRLTGKVKVQEEGVDVTNTPHAVLNFVGGTVTATDAGSGVTTISVSSGVIQDEGTPIAGAPHSTLNFVGAGVTVTDGGSGVATITIPGGGGGGNTLDGAYDQGGSGVGRIIVADTGAVEIQGPNDVTNAFYVNQGTVTIDADGGNTLDQSIPLHVFANDTSIAPSVKIRNTGTGDAMLNFHAGVANFDMGIDNSDSDAFKMGNSNVLGVSTFMHVQHNTGFMGLGNFNPGPGAPTPEVDLDLQGTMQWRGISAPAVSSAGNGRIYFDSTANKFKASENGAAYVDLIGAGGGGAFPHVLTDGGGLQRIVEDDQGTAASLLAITPASAGTSIVHFGHTTNRIDSFLVGDGGFGTDMIIRVDTLTTIVGAGTHGTPGTNSTMTGEDSQAGGTSACAYGQGAAALGSASIAWGAGAATATANRAVMGSSTAPITDFVIGEGQAASAPGDLIIRATQSTSGTRASTLTVAGGDGGGGVGGVFGGDLVLRAGDAGGAFAQGGQIEMQTALSNNLRDRVVVSREGDMSICGTENGAFLNFRTRTEVVDFSVSALTSTVVLNDDEVGFFLTVRVLTTITVNDGSTSVRVFRDDTDGKNLNMNFALAAGTTAGNIFPVSRHDSDDGTSIGAPSETGPVDFIFDGNFGGAPNGNNLTGGTVRVTLFYMDHTAPTS